MPCAECVRIATLGSRRLRQKGLMSVPALLTDQDRIALVEIELCGELMIAAAAAIGERLSQDRIDEVLMVGAEPEGRPDASAAR